MTSFQTLLCKIPRNLDQKQIFVEIRFTSQFLKTYKKYIFHVYDIISSLERSYRSAASTFLSAIQKTNSISNGLPNSNLIMAYVNSHEKRVAKLNQRAALLQSLLNEPFAKLKTNLTHQKKQLKIDLKNLKSLIQSSLDDLYKSINGYDKYFIMLQKTSSNSAYQSAAIPSKEQMKAITKLDEKLARTQTAYNIFHQKFAEYCRLRDIIFGKIDKLVFDTSEELKNIINHATRVDSSFLDEFEFNQPKIEVDLSSCFDEDENSEDENEQTFFFVNPEFPIVCGDTTLSPNETLAVMEAVGDMWTVHDRAGKQFLVPAKHLCPNASMNS
ncbi:hypothetical protein TRFO_28313 [Tritrichomonas foetus]|uniref:SH3 domain-containing protein n=1 Tax=Tritrichomonas foetus TaxID=1144522 RepID=A0A1J4K3D9_9EUKA|nr:hypothetical protein TRFO_28313 [Tritrichomonas foetus]|eukprot:OHT04260.1 hypothetical protein TRFO_28313 [Tritrichomonas foetus]